MSSVRDRIKAAEQASSSDKAQNASNLARRGTKLSLNTDEHIKEEFLRRGDGGWHKKVDIGQHQKFVAPTPLAPVIKLTADTPLVSTPSYQLPGKVDLPKAFGTTGESSKMNRRMSKTGAKSSPLASVEEDWQRVERLEAEQQEAMDLAEGKTRHGEWDRIAAMEAQQQAEMDAAAILAEAGKAEEKSNGTKARKKKATQWDKVAARETSQQADMDADAILDELSKDKKTKRRADIEAAAMLAEFEKEEAARKRVPGAFDDPFGFGAEVGNSSAPKAPKRKESMKAGSKKNVPAAEFEDLLDEEVIIDESPSHSRSPVQGRTKSNVTHISEDEEELLYQKPKVVNREKILFDPIEYQRKKQARQERRASRQLVEEVEDKSRPRTRAARSPSILLVHVNDDDDYHAHKSQHRSRSRSNHGHHDRQQRHSPDDHRRSSASLRPSSSSFTRRSVSDMLDPFMRSPRSSHHRSHSDNHSMASTRSEISVKKLEAVEYIAGKRLERLPLSSPKSPSRPAGFVRSKSHTGQYSEGFTHDRKLLRKPSDEDEVIDHVDHDWESPKQRRQSRHSHSRLKDEPWQLKILHEIVRR